MINYSELFPITQSDPPPTLYVGKIGRDKRVQTQLIFAVDNEAGRNLKYWQHYRHWCAENNLFWTKIFQV